MYLHKNCMRRRNNTIKKVMTKGPRNEIITSRCSLFTTEKNKKSEGLTTGTKLKYFL
jgi:hypothetical protein